MSVQVLRWVPPEKDEKKSSGNWNKKTRKGWGGGVKEVQYEKRRGGTPH